MSRTTGSYRVSTVAGETVRAFVPAALPPAGPPLRLEGTVDAACGRAMTAIARLEVAAGLVPSTHWFLYGFVRKEAVLTSQIEGTEATLRDVLEFEATGRTGRADDVTEVCNYVEALEYARREIAKPGGLPLSTRLLCEAHRRLLKGAGGRRGGGKRPGVIRTSQNWVGGTRPGNARFVPPPADAVPVALARLDRWIHGRDPLPPLVKAGLAHVQFETIHPFLDGNGRLGRLLIALLLHHGGLLAQPLLYLSLYLKQHRAEYYDLLDRVRRTGDWEAWVDFFLEGVEQTARGAVQTARRLVALFDADTARVNGRGRGTASAQRVLTALRNRPMLGLRQLARDHGMTFPTADKAMRTLVDLGIAREITGRRRNRIFAYDAYLGILNEEG